MNKRKTKIVCTLGPATDNENVLKQIMLSGMDVGRVNMSHQDIETQRERIAMFKKVREEIGLPIGLLLDTKGPEIRTGKFGDDKVILVENQKFTLTTDDITGNNKIVNVSFKDLPKDLSIGDTVLIDDGLIELRVDNIKEEKNIICTVINGGEVSSHKGINIPKVHVSLPFLSDKDKEDIKFAVEEDFDFIAASFTRSADDIMLLKKELAANGNKVIKIIAKIENFDGVKNIDEIIKVADGIMVARGDLGVEIPLEDIPIIQKELIKKCCKAGKIVVTATQMLDSMIKNPRPTRAEATDVANSVYDGTTAIMLSGETAIGAYPVEAVRTMSKIAVRTEEDINYIKKFERINLKDKNVTSAISHATCTTAHDIEATAIITVSKSGKTCTSISKYRPNSPIIAGTTSKNIMRQMNLEWGVTPLLIGNSESVDDLFENIINESKKHNLLKDGDLVVITAGIPVGLSGTTNLLKVHIVGDILVSGTSITQNSVCANLCVCKTEEELVNKFEIGDIVVLPDVSPDILPILKNAGGIVCEAPDINSHAAITGLTLNKPTIVGARHATDILKSGTTVTLNAARGVVYWQSDKMDF